MNRDEIIYCSNLGQLKQELADNGMVDEEGNYNHGNLLTPIVANAQGASLALCRNNTLDMQLFPSLQSLGDYEEIFANADSLALYKSVYPYHIPIIYIEDDGVKRVEKSYLRPKKIGAFA